MKVEPASWQGDTLNPEHLHDLRMQQLLQEISACTVCADHLVDGVRPVVAASPKSKIVVIGQAPGRRVHESGIPWDDKSGENLRHWLTVDPDTFYNSNLFAIVPMGFCFPGTGKSGDLPPRKECAPLWHARLLAAMPEVQLTLLIGLYAQKAYLGKTAKRTLTETVRAGAEYAPGFLPLPHPSPRNNIWQRKNPWFGEEILPGLRARVREILNGP